MTDFIFREFDRVLDTHYDNAPATVIVDVPKIGEPGDDGYAIVVVYDDEPDTLVSTGSDYFVKRGP